MQTQLSGLTILNPFGSCIVLLMTVGNYVKFEYGDSILVITGVTNFSIHTREEEINGTIVKK